MGGTGTWIGWFGIQKTRRVHHRKKMFVRGKIHINGIESFWGCAKTGLAKFGRVGRELFHFHLKKDEFRFNDRPNNLYHIMRRIFRKNTVLIMAQTNIYLLLCKTLANNYAAAHYPFKPKKRVDYLGITSIKVDIPTEKSIFYKLRIYTMNRFPLPSGRGKDSRGTI